MLAYVGAHAPPRRIAAGRPRSDLPPARRALPRSPQEPRAVDQGAADVRSHGRRAAQARLSSHRWGRRHGSGGRVAQRQGSHGPAPHRAGRAPGRGKDGAPLREHRDRGESAGADGPRHARLRARRAHGRLDGRRGAAGAHEGPLARNGADDRSTGRGDGPRRAGDDQGRALRALPQARFRGGGARQLGSAGGKGGEFHGRRGGGDVLLRARRRRGDCRSSRAQRELWVASAGQGGDRSGARRDASHRPPQALRAGRGNRNI